MKRILFTAAAILLSTATFIAPQAIAEVTVTVHSAPPAPRHEFVPAARHGYEWAPGFWNWNGRKYVWTKGHWERARAGFSFHRPEWQQGNDGWHLNRGGWQQGESGDGHHDRDGDGVPNRNDKQPDNPNRH